jgi:hypothetical protein
MYGVQNSYRAKLVMPYNTTRGPNLTIFGAMSTNLVDHACGIVCQKTDTQRFCELLQVIKQRITPGSPKPYYLVLDNHSCHDSKETRQWLYDNERDTFSFLFLVPSTPQFNSIECLWPHIRRNVRAELAQRVLDPLTQKIPDDQFKAILELAYESVDPKIIKNVVWANRKHLLAALAAVPPSVE